MTELYYDRKTKLWRLRDGCRFYIIKVDKKGRLKLIEECIV